MAVGDDAFRQSDVSRLERGKVGLPHRDRLSLIAAVLGLSPGELLARSGWSGADRVFSTADPRSHPITPKSLHAHAPSGSECPAHFPRCCRMGSSRRLHESSPRLRATETARGRSWPGARRRGPSTTVTSSVGIDLVRDPYGQLIPSGVINRTGLRSRLRRGRAYRREAFVHLLRRSRSARRLKSPPISAGVIVELADSSWEIS